MAFPGEPSRRGAGSVLSLLLLELQAFVSPPPPGPAFPKIPERSPSGGRAEGEKGGGGRQPGSRRLLFPDGDCQTLSASDPHESATSAFLECVTTSFTFRGPRFHNMSRSFGLTRAETHLVPGSVRSTQAWGCLGAHFLGLRPPEPSEPKGSHLLVLVS